MPGKDHSELSFSPFPIKLQYASNKGRYVISDRFIKKGDVILKTGAYAVSVNESYKKRICQQCLLIHPTKSWDLQCKGCLQVSFCSDLCFQNSSSKEGTTSTLKSTSVHPLICNSLRRLGSYKTDKHGKSLMKLFLQVVGTSIVERSFPRYWNSFNYVMKKQGHFESASTDDSKETSNPIDQVRYAQDDDEILEEIFCFNGIFDPLSSIYIPPTLYGSFNDVLRLQSHYLDWSSRDIQEWRKNVQFLYRELTEEIGFHDVQVNDIYELLSSLESNGFGVWSERRKALEKEQGEGQSLPQQQSGRCLFPLGSFFNHSCESNCEGVRVGSSLVFVAKEDIEEGEDMTISYIDTTQLVHQRQRQLLVEYFFECHCKRCCLDLSTKQSKAKTKKKH